ncbi:hypothetical protein [Bacillus solitudinis]|uniref:hypothetical protein n=1 Tax=Bacillus solitudinis TaxID=2014074 RepID=UPI000C23912C|nr:hypothetical protein [Bacillus solitudinis]
MKRIGLFLIVLIILYSTYYDLTIGTLPNGLTKQAQAINEETEVKNQKLDNNIDPNTLVHNDPYQEVVVEPGYTVLSIVEHLHQGPISPSIQEIMYDFEQLNPGTKADSLQIGKTYLFPIY